MTIQISAGEMVEIPEPLQWLLKEEVLVEEIKGHQAKIDSLRSLPRSQEEVRREIDRHMGGGAVPKLLDIMKRYQAREIDAITGDMLIPVVLASILQAPTIGELVGRLSKTLSQKERESQIAALEEKVQNLMVQLESDCWPAMRGNPNEGPDGGLEWLRDWAWKCKGGWLHPVTGLHMVPGSPIDRVAHHFHIGPGFNIGSYETLQTLRQRQVHPF